MKELSEKLMEDRRRRRWMCEGKMMLQPVAARSIVMDLGLKGGARRADRMRRTPVLLGAVGVGWGRGEGVGW